MSHSERQRLLARKKKHLSKDLITSRNSGFTSSGNSSAGFNNNSYGYFATAVRFKIFCF